MFADGAGAGHPGDGAVGSLAGEAEHTGRESRDHHGAVRPVKYVQLGVDVVELAGELHPALVDERAQDRKVFAGVQRGTVVGEAETLLDAGAVGRADAQDEPAVGGGGRGQRLLGQRHGMPGVGGNHADARSMRLV